MRESTDTLGLYNNQYQNQLATSQTNSTNTTVYPCNTYSSQSYVAPTSNVSQQNVLPSSTPASCSSSTTSSNGFTSVSDTYYQQQKMNFNQQMAHSTNALNASRTNTDPALAQYLISNQNNQNSYSNNDYYSAPYSYNNLQIDSWPRYMNSERNLKF